ncbi:MAG: hypothetical protein KIS80_03085 [Anaerolineales bacterium]|nr:hypothetical protein [Anaerolineales bacterium]
MKQFALWISLFLAGVLTACVTASPETPEPQQGQTAATQASNPTESNFGNCANHAQLSIAYIKDGDIWLWVEGTGRRQLTTDGDARDLRISDDGCRVAYAREVANPNYDPSEPDEYDLRLRELEELWMVFSDGTGQQQLASVEQFPRPHDDYQTPGVWQVREDGFMDTTLYHFMWQSGGVKVAFSTAAAFDGPGPFPHQDVYLVDTETLEFTPLLPVGRGGNFVFSPDGAQLAFAAADRIGVLNVDGSDLRDSLFSFAPILTYTEGRYYPHLYWTQTGDLVFALPPVDALAELFLPEGPSSDTILWYLPLDGAPAFEAGAIQTAPLVGWVTVTFSPDLGRIAYLRSMGQPQLYQAPPRELVIALSNGSQESASFSYPQILFGDWAPDNQRFIYSYEEDGLHFVISNVDGDLHLPVDMPSLPQVYSSVLNWVSDDVIALSLAVAGGTELYLIRPNQGVELLDTLGNTHVWTIDATH